MEPKKDNQVSFEGYEFGQIGLEDGAFHGSYKNVNKSTFSLKMELDVNVDTPIGRNNWTVIDFSCNIKSPTVVPVTISVCKFKDEFSCSSGACINIYKRCDNVIDCEDESDEKDCKIFKLPESYDKSSAPKNGGEEGKASLYTTVDIINIDKIDTIAMEVGLTIELAVEWRDKNVEFQNIQDQEGKIGEYKQVSEDQYSRI